MGRVCQTSEGRVGGWVKTTVSGFFKITVATGILCRFKIRSLSSGGGIL